MNKLATRSKWFDLLRTPLGITALVLLALIGITAVIAPMLLNSTATVKDLGEISQSPSAEHLFGTDPLGRDLFARTLVATRLSVLLALLATVFGVALGLVLGLLPLITPRWLSRGMIAGIDIAIAFPALLLALFFAVIFGVGMVGAVLAISIAIAPGFARLTYTLGSSVSARDYVAAARVSGIGRITLLRRHVLPNIGDPLVVNATMIAGDALLSFAALSFLGIGIQAPQYDWGRLFNDGLPLIYSNPLASIGPGIAILIAVLAFNLLGEATAQIVGTRRAIARAFLPGVAARRIEPDELALASTTAVLIVDDLEVAIDTPEGRLTPVRGVSLQIEPGEAVGLVGESGSGKSTTAMAIAGLLPDMSIMSGGRITIDGVEISDPNARSVRKHLATRLAYVFQDPMTSFNPAQRMGTQLAEPAREHLGYSRRSAWARAVDRLRAMQIAEPERRAKQLPHEFSGGMRQRAMIGLGLMGDPALIIADEPTSALDVTVQAEVLRLLDEARHEHGASLLLISHDLGLVARHCSRVLVMYAGRIVEDLPVSGLHEAHHPYTRALLGAVPTFDTNRDEPMTVIPGRPPRLNELTSGCAFAARCPLATDHCRATDPDLVPTPTGGSVACWHPVDPGADRLAPAEPIGVRL